MNRLTKFFHEMWNPHCEHCMELAREDKICSSCEILKSSLATLTDENRRLMSVITNKPEKTEPVQDTRELKPVMPRNLPFSMRRQMLEAEDRAAAKLLKNNPTSPGKIEGVDELEKELDIAQAKREVQA
jgi:hypothetical protein